MGFAPAPPWHLLMAGLIPPANFEIFRNAATGMYMVVDKTTGITVLEVDEVSFLSNALLKGLKHGKHRRPRKARDSSTPHGTSGSPRPTAVAHALSVSGERASVPYAGIRAGEIDGWKMWLLHTNRRISSLTNPTYWEPGMTVMGDVDKVCYGFGNRRALGVYAYNSPEVLMTEVSEYEDHLQHKNRVEFLHHRRDYLTDIWSLMDDSMENVCELRYTFHGIVFGQVKLWGEVVEHEQGYRAQCCKIRSLIGYVGLNPFSFDPNWVIEGFNHQTRLANERDKPIS